MKKDLSKTAYDEHVSSVEEALPDKPAPATAGEQVQANTNPAPFVDTPLLAAKRKAFDNPTQDNLDALINASLADEREKWQERFRKAAQIDQKQLEQLREQLDLEKRQCAFESEHREKYRTRSIDLRAQLQAKQQELDGLKDANRGLYIESNERFQQLAAAQSAMKHVIALLEGKFDELDKKELLKVLHLTQSGDTACLDAVVAEAYDNGFRLGATKLKMEASEEIKLQAAIIAEAVKPYREAMRQIRGQCQTHGRKIIDALLAQEGKK